jgi:superfamily II DNA or RNA helicase
MLVEFDFDTVARKPKIVSEYLTQIRELFSVEDKALVFMRRRTGRSNMPVRKYAITNKGHFDLPFFRTLLAEIKTNFPSLQFKINSRLEPFITPKPLATVPVQLNLTPRDYQLESATRALNSNSGIIVLPTSAGKTLTMALIVATAIQDNKNNVLVLVPNIQLVEQSYQDFIEYGIDPSLVSRWTGNHDYSSTKIVIANNQILLSKMRDKSVLSQFNVLLCDEVHKISTAEKISKFIKELNANYKFGLTGSLPENEFDKWSINRIFGPVLYEKRSIELREEKFISKVRVVGLEMEYKNVPQFTRPTMSDPTAGYMEETEWLHTNSFRNSTICKIISKLDTNTLILVDRIAHGEHLLEYLTASTTKQIYFIHGSVEVEEREKAKQIMEDSSNVVFIAISNIFSTGISIKNLHNIVFASIGKARIKIIQSIGRSLRLHHTKQIATIFDIADVGLTYGFKHYEERKKLYAAENIPLTCKQLVEN